MYICLCHAVTDKRIHAAVHDGVSSFRELNRELRVGSCCGKCVTAARDELGKALSTRDGSSSACRTRPMLLAELQASAG